MKVVEKVELSQNDKTFIEQLKELSIHISTEKVFACKGIGCKSCPFYVKTNGINRCEVGHLLNEMARFIELTEEI